MNNDFKTVFAEFMPVEASRWVGEQIVKARKYDALVAAQQQYVDSRLDRRAGCGGFRHEPTICGEPQVLSTAKESE